MTRRFFVAAAVVAIAGCSLDKQTAPPLSGPSELGLSLAISATPDNIQQDGSSRATIEVLARDANGQPVAGLSLQAQTTVGGVDVDFGTLSAKIVSTDNAGKAFLFYTAPPKPSPTVTSDTVVSIKVTPIGTNYNGAVPRAVDVRLRRPGVIQDPGDGPKASFFFSPTAPRSEDDVFFDGSASTGNIVSYQWTFGDGRTGTGVTTRHHYDLPGKYSVVLTVVDDLGRASSSAPTDVTVAALANPTAEFVYSPTNPRRSETVSFNGSLSKAEVGHTIVKYTWDFGDGSPLVDTTGPTVQKAFGGSGTADVIYTIVLKVTDDVGRTAAVSKTLTVKP